MAGQDDVPRLPRDGSLPNRGGEPHSAGACELVPRASSRANKWWSAKEHAGGLCSRVLGRSRVSEGTLQRLAREGKIPGCDGARLPHREETEPQPGAMEAIVFVAFFDAGLRIPCALFVGEVLRAYGLEIAQLTPNAIICLAIFTWVMRTEGRRPSASLFAALHDACCRPRNVEGATSNFGSVDFVLRASCSALFPAPAFLGRWESGWTRRWFYHVTDKSGLQCQGGPIAFNCSPSLPAEFDDMERLQSLAGVARRMSVRDLVEEYTMYGVAPLSKWRYAGRGDDRGDGLSPSISRLHPPSAPCKPASACVCTRLWLRRFCSIDLLSSVQWLGWRRRSMRLRRSLARTR